MNTPSNLPTRLLLPFCAALLAALAVALGSVTVFAVDVYWTGAAGDGLWSNRTNWTPMQVPADSDQAFISSPGSNTVVVSGLHFLRDLTVGSGSNAPTLHLPSGAELVVWGEVLVRSNAWLHLDSGTLGLDYRGEPRPTVTNQGTILWTGGQILGAGAVTVAESGLLRVEGAAGKTNNGASLLNLGTVNWNSTASFALVGTMTNAGTLVLETGLDMGGFSFVLNKGLIQVPASKGLVQFDAWGFENAGGVLCADSCSVLELASQVYGEVYIRDGSTVAGAGVVLVRGGGTLDPRIHWEGSTHVSGTLELNGGDGMGHPTFAGPGVTRLVSGSLAGATVAPGAHFDLIGGTLAQATIPPGAGFVMSGGTLSNPSIEVGAELLVADGTSANLTGRLTNNGTVRWQRGAVVGGTGGTWLNNGLLLLETNCNLLNWTNTTFLNAGTVEAPANAGVVTLLTSAALTNSGTLRANTNSILCIEKPSGTLHLEDGSAFVGPGAVRLEGAHDTVWLGTPLISCPVEYQVNGTLTGNPTLSGPGSFHWKAGTIEGLTVPSGFVATVEDGDPIALIGNLTNNGTLKWRRAAPMEGGLSSLLVNSGVFLMETNCSLSAWLESELRNTGVLEAPANAGTVALTLGRSDLLHSGTIRAGSNTTFEIIFENNDSILTVLDGAQFDGDGVVHLLGGALAYWAGTNVVSGVLRVGLGGPWPALSYANVFTGPGLLHWSSGVLGSVTFDSAFNVQLAGVLDLDGPSTNNGTIRFVPPFPFRDADPPLGRRVGFDTIDLFVNNGTLSLEANGGLQEVIRFDGGYQNEGGFLNYGTIMVPADLGQVQVMMTGQITNASTITVGSNSVLHLFGDSDMLQLVFDTTILQGEGAIQFEAFANVTWSGTNFIGCPVAYAPQYVGMPQSLTHATLTGPGPFEVGSGALWNLTLDAGLTVNVTVGVVLGGDVTNLGTVNWLAMMGDMVADDADARFYNVGRLVVETNAILNCEVPFHNAPSGVLTMKTRGEASGFLLLTNSGLMEIHSGTLGVTDRFTQTPTGVLRFALGGCSVGFEHGRLVTLTNAPLAGAFEAVLTNGFVPTNGSVFQLVTFPFDPPTGQFAPEVFPPLPAPLGWETDYTPTELLLRVVSPLALTAPTMLGDGSFRLTLTGTPGQTHVLLASTNLVDWTPLKTNTLCGESWTVVDSNAALFPHRFYQAR